MWQRAYRPFVTIFELVLDFDDVGAGPLGEEGIELGHPELLGRGLVLDLGQVWDLVARHCLLLQATQFTFVKLKKR